ncbi:condensation protein [Streptomyces antarcticus]|uniref:condensation protein n=1 Tax=Streptomyces antarcticus TaxID=2996458 RepID=UPI00226F722F|nr:MULTISPECIES: condensation protein [unclassified Streptomyces]MCY0943304.1 condensation protein [Streptomyces sp. H34-AA3]MCZ4082507.1 condensation protein [Streptomyces sp. H34-S5]
MDEYSRHLLQEHLDADTVHLEAHLPGTVDVERLRAAFTRTLAGHPTLQVRQSDSRWWHRRYHWEPAPIGPTAVAATADLGHTRHRALTEPPPLAAGPPLRLETAPAPGGGTALLLTAAHTLADAGTCLRLLCDLADHYSGTPVGERPVGSAGERSVGATGQRSVGTSGQRSVGPADASATARASSARGGRPMRIAPAASPSPGTGVHLSVLPLPRTGASKPRPTVNDLLLTAVQLTLAEWNHRHDHPTGPIHLSMPIDDRPYGPLAPGAPMGNHNHLATIRAGTPAPDAGAATLLGRISAQTRAAKAAPVTGGGLIAGLVSTPWLPVGAKAPLTRTLRRVAAPWTSTALVSNLGQVTHPLDFGPAGQPDALWFSAPVRMPRGLSVSALTLDGRLHLAVRHCHQLLGQPAAAELARRCAETLDALAQEGRRR